MEAVRSTALMHCVHNVGGWAAEGCRWLVCTSDSLNPPSFFGTKSIGAPAGLVEGRIYFFLKASARYSRNASSYSSDKLYSGP
jgi:hypothetical protein